MNAGWNYFWPPFAGGLLIGTVIGLIAFRHRAGRNLRLGVAFAVTIVFAALWHGPFGAADRFASQVERNARVTLDAWEMTRVTAHLHDDPLTRQLLLAGPADDFQQSELVRILDQLPGVSSATWSSGGGTPLIVEGAALAVLGFLLGLLVAYLVELRRRYNAQWNW